MFGENPCKVQISRLKLSVGKKVGKIYRSAEKIGKIYRSIHLMSLNIQVDTYKVGKERRNMITYYSYTTRSM